jgi:hypothetical protein
MTVRSVSMPAETSAFQFSLVRLRVSSKWYCETLLLDALRPSTIL